MTIIGNRITILRTRKGITQKKLAQLSNITEASLSRYENGLREPKISTLIKISDVLDSTVDYLIGKTDIENGVIVNKLTIPEKLRDIRTEYLLIARDLEKLRISPKDVNNFITIITNHSSRNNSEANFGDN
ncbi:MAG: helix-turn-helix transcriptional regulator [Acidaminobacteraceae bacterium]